MKYLILICALFAAQCLLAQTNESPIIKFYLKNAELLPKKITLISYSPGTIGNGTVGYIFFPGIKKSVSYRVGTKLYLANSKQVGIVMSGNRIDKDKPFLLVSASDVNKIFNVK